MRPERLMSVRDFAAFMDVSPHTVWRWAREGRISLYGVGRPRVDVAEAMEQLKRTPSAPVLITRQGGAYRASQFRPGQAGRPRGQRASKRPA